MIDDALDVMRSGLVSAFNEGDYSDLTVTCGELTFKVHKVILANSSDFFRKRFPRNKAATSHIDLPDDDPQMVRRMILYFYCLDYDPTAEHLSHRLAKINHHNGPVEIADEAHPRVYWRISTNGNNPGHYNTLCACYCPPRAGEYINQPMGPLLKVPPEMSNYSIAWRVGASVQITNPLAVHASMYALAEKYQSHYLMYKALEKFKQCLNDHWDTPDFVRAVSIVFSSTPEGNRGMRDVVRQAVQARFQVNTRQIPGVDEELSVLASLLSIF